MKPTEELAHEHKVITHVLKVVAAEAQNISNKTACRAELIEMMLDFSRNFTDKCHHAKEEKNLFPMLEKKGMPHDTGPIAVMLAEHSAGRQMISRIAGLLSAAEQEDKKALLSLAESLSDYVNLLESHIDKENNILFPMAERLLGEAEMAELEKAFALVEAIETGEGVHEKYHQLAHKISAYR